MVFSIVVPTYNSEEYLSECIDSVLRQSYEDWELIIVNDGSTDGSLNIAESYAKKDCRVKVFSQNNSGQFFARQNGIEQAEGEYIIFLDSDDCLVGNCLETIKNNINTDNSDIVLYIGKIVSEGKDTGRRIGRVEGLDSPITVDWLKHEFIKSNALNSLFLKAIRRKLFVGDECKYEDMVGVHCGEDKIRLLYPLTVASSVSYIDSPLYEYNYRDSSVMHRANINNLERELSIQMFKYLAQYMEIWNLKSTDDKRAYDAYIVSTFYTCYIKYRKLIRSKKNESEKRLFNQYLNEFQISMSKLPIRERLKLTIIKYSI